MVVVDAGVIAAVVLSNLGVGKTFVAFPAVALGRENRAGAVTTDGVLGGKGGYEEEAFTASFAPSIFTEDVMIFRTPGVVRFSMALGAAGATGMVEVGFLGIAVDNATLVEIVAFDVGGPGVVFALLLSKAGKSSG